MAYKQARTHLPSLKVPSKFLLYWQKWNLFYANRRVFTRADIDQNWSHIGKRLKRYKIFGITPVRSLATLWLDFQVTAMFTYALFRSRNKQMSMDIEFEV
jgi:hypothetical protein